MPKKIKSVSAGQVKAGPDDGLKDGEFIVYPSTFTKEPDSYGELIMLNNAFASLSLLSTISRALSSVIKETQLACLVAFFFLLS